MLIKLFVSGLPGSGKSTISRAIVSHVEQRYTDWSARRECDYDILHQMFLEDREQQYFYPLEPNGFCVKDCSRYDLALKKLKEKISNLQRFRYRENELTVVEFARRDYVQSLKLFGQDFLKDSYFLFLNARMRTCMERVEERIQHPSSLDDHFVSQYTFEYFTHQDNEQYLRSLFPIIRDEFEIQDSRIIDSDRSREDTILDALSFVDEIITQGAPMSQENQVDYALA